MKKSLLLITFLCSIGAYAQPHVWQQLEYPNQRLCYFVQYQDPMQNPIGPIHIYLEVDSAIYMILTDTVYLQSLDGTITHTSPSSLVYAENGILKNVPIDSLHVSWDKITGKPVISTFSGSWNDLEDKPTTFTPSAHTHSWSDITGAPAFGFGTVTNIGLISSDLSVSGSPVTTSGNITANLTTTGVSVGTYDWVTVDTKGRVTAAGNSPLPTTIAAGGRNFNQAYQISSTRPTTISVSVQISCNLSLTGGQAGNIQLQISANGSSGWITVSQLTASNTGTLTVGLNTTQISGGQLVYEGLPAGYYWRILTTNTTGTPTYTFNGGFEKVY